jgi:hypothetical protein
MEHSTAERADGRDAGLVLINNGVFMEWFHLVFFILSN